VCQYNLIKAIKKERNLTVKLGIKLYNLDSLSAIKQRFSTFVRPRPGKFFFYKTKARYRPAAHRFRNAVIKLTKADLGWIATGFSGV
jgi:hypothetical protein